MEFRVLGPLEVRSDGRTLAVSGQKQRILLAALLLERNRVVSSDRLIDALWDEQPPPAAQKALQVHVSQLRKHLGRERLETSAPGYRLNVGPGELDLDRFTALREQGRPRDALELWRGPPLADFAYARFAQAEIDRLDELRLECIEERIDADLAAGRQADVVAELESLLARHPLRERLREQLLLALYRGGRQADALQVYRSGRAALVEELGIEPGRRLRDLQQAILTQDPSLDLAPRADQPPGGTFVGRATELAQLTAGLDDAIAGRGRLLLLEGEPGIGKSRLAEELLARARERGARVLVGRCWEAGGAPAYWPWVQSLRPYLRDADRDALRAELGEGAADIAAFMPELRELFADLPAPAATESEGARFRLFDSITAFLKRVAAARPLVLAFDDLHAADEPSLLLLRFLAREIAHSRVLFIGAYRDVDPLLADPLTTALTELVREPVTATVTLRGLGEADVAHFIEVAAGGVPAPGLSAAVHAETDGNPLFVVEIVRLLAAEGRLDEADAPLLAIPQSVKEVIGRRLRRLSAGCNDVLTHASVLGREFDLDTLAAVAGLDRDGLFTLLDEAMGARVVTEVPGAMGRLRFAHALIRDSAYQGLTAARRVQLHRRAGEALEVVHSANLEPRLAELAYHFFEAAPGGEASKAIDYSRRAAERAASVLAHEEAVRLYEMALTLKQAPDAARCELLLALGDAQARAGDTVAATRVYREAAELAEELTLPDHVGRAALGYGGRMLWEVAREDDYWVPLLERAIAGLGDEDSALRVRLLARFAGGPLRDARFPPERRAAVSAQALAMARRIGDPLTLAYALQGYIGGHHSPDHTAAQLELATELIAIATEHGEPELALDGHEQCLLSLVELGRVGEAKVELAAMEALARQLRQPAHDWLVAVYGPLFALLEGRLSEAERLISDARALGERAQGWNAEVTYRLQLFLLRRLQGRLGEIEQLVRRSTADYPTYPIWRCVLVRTEVDTGAEHEARAALHALAADGFDALPFDEEQLVSLSLLAEAAGALGDEECAAALYDRLLPYADRVAVSYPEICVGPVARFLGLLAATASRPDEAARHFEQAIAIGEAIGARPWEALAREGHGRLLVDSGEAERGQALLSDARAAFRELGMR